MSAPQRFRMKPVEVYAMLLTEDNIDEVAEWCRGTHGRPSGVVIDGVMKANIGDWVIRSESGNFWPCEPDVFAETYHRMLGASL